VYKINSAPHDCAVVDVEAVSTSSGKPSASATSRPARIKPNAIRSSASDARHAADNFIQSAITACTKKVGREAPLRGCPLAGMRGVASSNGQYDVSCCRYLAQTFVAGS